MDDSIFYQLSLVLALAAGISVLARLFRQPPIIGYIVSGFLVGPALLNVIHAREAFDSFSQIGIALLLFMIGLSLNVRVIRSMGKPAVLTFVLIIAGLGTAGYGVSLLLGFDTTESLLIATALLFSSTIIVVKVLSDKKGQSRLYGQLAIGVLLVEDIAATLAILAVSAVAGGSTVSDFGWLALKGLAIGTLLALLGAYVMPRLAKFFAHSQELLFLFSLAWTFGIASAFSWAGFSLEVGALFAGVTLAHLPYAQEMATRLKPLRDFFIILFFIGLGIHLGIDRVGPAIVPALVISALVMFFKPLLTLAGLGLLGYTKQTGFKAAVHLSQISEFSIILIVLAASTGLVSDHVVTVMTLVALITIVLSTYLMKYDDKLYRRFKRALAVFERKKTQKELGDLKYYPLVLLGFRKGGYEFVKTFRRMKKEYIVIDFNPEIIENLETQGIHHVYGDATDLELLEELGVHRSELVISVISDVGTNGLIAAYLKRHNKQALFICHAGSYDDAAELYKKGAAYVILPNFIGTEQISSFIRKHGSNKKAYERYRLHHLISLGKVAAEG
ncbi:MAG: cation:proton antiporter [Candidatus Saccharimonadales bacterium]